MANGAVVVTVVDCRILDIVVAGIRFADCEVSVAAFASVVFASLGRVRKLSFRVHGTSSLPRTVAVVVGATLPATARGALFGAC